MILLEPLAAAVAAVVVLGGFIFAAWAVLECFLSIGRRICANGQRAIEEDPHG